MERDSCVMYRSFFDCAKGYDEITRLRIYEAIMGYMFYGIEYKGEDPAVNMAMVLAGPIIKKSIVKYENGKKGGRPKKNKEIPEKKKDVAIMSAEPSSRGSAKDKHGHNGNVKLSKEEYNILVNTYGKAKIDKTITDVDLFAQALSPKKQKEYFEKNHKAYIEWWLRNDEKAQKASISKMQEYPNKFNSFEQNSYTHEEMKVLEAKLVEN